MLPSFNETVYNCEFDKTKQLHFRDWGNFASIGVWRMGDDNAGTFVYLRVDQCKKLRKQLKKAIKRRGC